MARLPFPNALPRFMMELLSSKGKSFCGDKANQKENRKDVI